VCGGGIVEEVKEIVAAKDCGFEVVCAQREQVGARLVRASIRKHVDPATDAGRRYP
jgi:hypothetical protein